MFTVIWYRSFQFYLERPISCMFWHDMQLQFGRLAVAHTTFLTDIEFFRGLHFLTTNCWCGNTLNLLKQLKSTVEPWLSGLLLTSYLHYPSISHVPQFLPKQYKVNSKHRIIYPNQIFVSENLKFYTGKNSGIYYLP